MFRRREEINTRIDRNYLALASEVFVCAARGNGAAREQNSVTTPV